MPTSATATAPKPILELFEGTFARPQLPVRYQFALIAASAAMVVLPLIYLGITVLAGWLVYLQATNGVYFGRGIWAIITYLTPIVAGVILVFFMVKPLFARPERAMEAIPVGESEEPLLRALVRKVCELVGAPEPREIRVDCQVNASASFRRGLVSFFGNDLVLTIGMPLAAGLRADQLTAVLAHEFGHFSQGGGMRLTYVVRSISAWFHRVVYERDEWDARLDRWASEVDFRISIMLWIAKLGIWVSRKILWLLMIVGAAISGFLLRQMEFDADLHEIRLAGSDTFVDTAMDIEYLSAASQAAHSQLQSLWQDKELVRNMPALVTAVRGRFADEAETFVKENVANAKTGRLDTHPATHERIAAAKAEAAHGVFHYEEPAAALFSDFEALSERVTEHYFREGLSLEYDTSKALSMADVEKRWEESRAAQASVDAVTGGLVRFSHPAGLPEVRGLEPQDALAQAREARRRLDDRAEQLREAIKAFDASWERRGLLEQADALLRADIGFNAGEIGLSRASTDVVDSALAESDKELEPFHAAAAEIQEIVELRLGAQQELVFASEGDGSQAEWTNLAAALRALASAGPVWDELNRNVCGLGAIAQNVTAESQEAAMTPYQNISNSAAGRVKTTLSRIGDAVYPFPRASGACSIKEYLLADAEGGTHAQAAAIVERAPDLYFRTLGRLCEIGLAAEQAASD